MELKPTEFLELISRLAEMNIEVHEQVAMDDGADGPLYDKDGQRVINDVVIIDDARFFIERDDNDPETVQDFVTFLAALQDYMADLALAYQIYLPAMRGAMQANAPVTNDGPDE